jgi:hypothetical protein
VVAELPKVDNGFVSAPDLLGLGLALQPQLLTRADVSIRAMEG